jgi:hypothetical protein
MINFKKGPALSLHQVNYVGKPDLSDNTPSTGIVAGMVVRVNTDGTIGTGSTGTPATDKSRLFGFAINSQSSGDVIEAGVIGVYALDGASVIETDQFEGSIGAYAIGQVLTTNTAGQVTNIDPATTSLINPASFTGKVIGWVEGTRTLPGKSSSTASLTNQVTNTATGRSFTYQTDATVLGVKLAS